MVKYPRLANAGATRFARDKSSRSLPRFSSGDQEIYSRSDGAPRCQEGVLRSSGLARATVCNDRSTHRWSGECAVSEDIRLRRAEPGDVDFVLELLTHEEVEPYMAVIRPRDRDGVLAEIERSQDEPQEFGRFVIEVDGERAGAMGFEVANRRSRIANLERLAVHPAFRGRRVADDAARLLQRHLLVELGYHRLQLEIYGFNERGIAHAERSGFVREGVKRKAYLRHGDWVDAVTFGLLREDLQE